MRITSPLAAVLAAAALATTACGTTTSPSTGTPSSSRSSSSPGASTAASGQHDEADVGFATEMIPHHTQAIAMAAMAEDQASDPALRTLARAIQTAQGPEIRQMSGWLRAWGEKVPDVGGDASGMQGMGSGAMPGMMGAGEMTRLGRASGSAFDQMWLQMMVRHHEGAIEMAQTEQQDGRSPEAVDLARDIEAGQSREVTTMRQMLQR